MKKSLLILLILCVAASLFAAAGFSVNAGPSFDLFFLRTTTFGEPKKSNLYSGNGLGFDIGAQYDFNDKIMAYADFNMAFPSDFKISDADNYLTFKEYVKFYEIMVKLLSDGKVSHPLFHLDASIGAAYKFDLDSVKLAVGVGAYLNLLNGSIHATASEGLEDYDQKQVFKFFTAGVSTLIDAKYMINENFGIRLALMPQLGIFSKNDIEHYISGAKQESSVSYSGVGVSFTMPVTIGASYSF